MLSWILLLFTATSGTNTFATSRAPVGLVARRAVGWTDIAVGEFPKGGKQLRGTITSFTVNVNAMDQNWGNCGRGTVRLVAYRGGKAAVQLWRSWGSKRGKCMKRGANKRLNGDVPAFKLAQLLPNDKIGFQWECRCTQGHTYRVNKVSGKYRLASGKSFGTAMYPIGKSYIKRRLVGWTNLAVGNFPKGGKVVGNVQRFYVSVNAKDQNWGNCGRGSVRLVIFRGGKAAVQLWRSWGATRHKCRAGERLRGWVAPNMLAKIKPTDKVGFQWECNCRHGHTYQLIQVRGFYQNGGVSVSASYPIGKGIIRNRRIGWTDMAVGNFPRGGKVLGHLIKFTVRVNADDQNWGNCWRGSVRLVAYRNGKAAVQLWRSAGANRSKCDSGRRLRGAASAAAIAKLKPTDKIGFQYECACTQGHTYKINSVNGYYLTTEHRRRKQLPAPKK